MRHTRIKWIYNKQTSIVTWSYQKFLLIKKTKTKTKKTLISLSKFKRLNYCYYRISFLFLSSSKFKCYKTLCTIQTLFILLYLLLFFFGSHSKFRCYKTLLISRERIFFKIGGLRLTLKTSKMWHLHIVKLSSYHYKNQI